MHTKGQNCPKHRANKNGLDYALRILNYEQMTHTIFPPRHVLNTNKRGMAI